MAHFIRNILSAATLALGSSALQAATLNPGDSIFVPGSTVASQPELGGAVVQDNIISSNFVRIPAGLPFGASFNVQNRVVESAVDGQMVFAPRIRFLTNISFGNMLVDRVVMSGFGNFDIDASYRIDGLGDRGPTTGSRSADGDILDFGFDFPLVISNLFAGVHEESYFFALKTGATAFENTGRLSIFARAQGDDFNTYRFDVAGLAVPVDAPVPVPAPIFLMLSGLAAFLGLRRPRRWRGLIIAS